MKNILITGGCGFVGSNLAIFLKKNKYNIYSLDNLSRKGSLLNLKRLRNYKIKNFNLDISDHKILKLRKFDLIIDCCAEPSVLASTKSAKESERVFKSNLIGTFYTCQKCLLDKSNIIFVSTSRVYSIKSINEKFLKRNKQIKNKLKLKYSFDENFDTGGVKSLYGWTKLSSEELIKEYAYSNNLKYIINRCGVIAGPWQFGKVDQGFMSLWSWKFLNKSSLKYIGFGGNGYQVRDVLHIHDFCELILKQIKQFKSINNETFVVGGSKNNAISLKDLTEILNLKTGYNIKVSNIRKTSLYDVPYFVSNNRKVSKLYKWKPKKNIYDILDDIIKWQNNNMKILKKYFK